MIPIAVAEFGGTTVGDCNPPFAISGQKAGWMFCN